MSAKYNHEILKYLIETFNLNYNVVNKDRWTPLHYACY